MKLSPEKDHKGKLKGVFPATLTPMRDDLSVNSELLVKHCKWLLENGADGITVSGTTGEANSLSVAEKMIMLDDLVAGGISPEKLIVGTGCCAFPDTVALTRHALKHGVSGILMLPPFYYKGVSDAGLFNSFEQVIQRVGDENLRIYLYHFPRMSATPISMQLIERLLKHYPHQIAGVKDSSGDWENMKGMVEAFPGFSVFAGTEAFLLDILRIGGVGCISASANVTIRFAGQVYSQWERPEAEGLQSRLTALRLALQQYPFIPGLKGMLADFSGDVSWNNMRPPHVPSSRNEIEMMLEEFARLTK